MNEAALNPISRPETKADVAHRQGEYRRLTGHGIGERQAFLKDLSKFRARISTGDQVVQDKGSYDENYRRAFGHE